MATNPFGGSALSRSLFPTPSKPSKPHGVLGFFENFGKDVGDAVTGLPTGIVHLAEHPIGGVEQMAKSTWQTWSPLFHGELGKFAHGVYTHPLAPLLDVASVFSGGLGAAGKLGRLTEASDASLLGKAARLTEPKTADLVDLSGKERHAVPFHYSTKPLRRLTQEQILPKVVGRLPESAQTALRQAKYEKGFLADMAHRQAAVQLLKRTAPEAAKAYELTHSSNPLYKAAGKSMILTTQMLAGKALSDPVTAVRARSEIAAGLVLNLHRHAPLTMSPEDAMSFLQKNKHYVPLRDPALIDRTSTKILRGVKVKEARWERHRATHAEAAHSLPQIRAELDQQNAILKDMHEHGYLMTEPAKTKLREPTTRQLIEARAVPVKEVEGNVKRLEKQLSDAHTSKKIHDRAVQELGSLKAQRMELEQRSFAQYFQHVGQTESAFESFANNLGRHATVSIGRGTKGHIAAALSKASRTRDGMVRLVPKHDPTMLGREAVNSSKFVKWLWQKPTQIWKTIQVGYTPRTVTNNSVGNFTIAMLRQGPVSTIHGVLTAHRILHGDERAGEILMHATPFKRNHWMFRHFSTERNNVFGHELLTANGARISALKSGFYPLVHKIADEPIRMGAISEYLRHAPEVRSLMIEKGLTFDQAAARALRKTPDLQARAADYARSVAGDYQTLRPWEQKLKQFVPFYLWDRHILRSTGNLVADTPGRAVLIQQLSQMGNKDVEKYLGQLPEFLHSVIPLDMLGLHSSQAGRADVLSTQSLNPFSTIGDLGRTAQAVAVGGTVNPGSDLFSQANPLLTGAIAYGTGKSLLTGAPISRHGGLLSTEVANLGAAFPQAKLVTSLLGPTTDVTKRAKQKMLASDHRTAITSLLGVPIRSVGLLAAQEAAAKESGQKKGRARHKNPFGG